MKWYDMTSNEKKSEHAKKRIQSICKFTRKHSQQPMNIIELNDEYSLKQEKKNRTKIWIETQEEC